MDCGKSKWQWEPTLQDQAHAWTFGLQVLVISRREGLAR